MNYEEALAYLFNRLPVFQNQGARAYKPGLSTTQAFCARLGNPQEDYKTIHIGGTNGKGSTSHMLASVLQQAGYRVGLYTSPHLKSFTERIRVDGVPVRENFVSDFITIQKSFIEQYEPSFFEVTVAMAFSYFSVKKVDIAVIEVGMGGRLDSTNVITPVLSLITNISWDHTQYLGDTLPKIAREKAGIIKPDVPVVLSEQMVPEVMQVFKDTAAIKGSQLILASEYIEILSHNIRNETLQISLTQRNLHEIKTYALDLVGDYQLNNIKGVLSAIDVLRRQGLVISEQAVLRGLDSVRATTGLKGRWQTLRTNPLVICDTAHNAAGMGFTIQQFRKIPARRHRFILGFVADKSLDSILMLFHENDLFYFCQPNNSRALPVKALVQKAKDAGLVGEGFDDVNSALEKAIQDSDINDAIYVGGSTFVVADLSSI